MVDTCCIIITNILLASSNEGVSLNIGASTSTPPTFQRAGVTLPRLNTAYYSQGKGNEPSRISLRPS